jgi:multicomponent Na+:H+ antiporter subunit G
MEIFGSIVALLGSLFLLLSSVGILRMPDAYNRMQTGTKATTIGALLFLCGLCLSHGDQLPMSKIIGLILFILFTNPVAGHTLLRAAHFSGVPMTSLTVVNQLKEDEEAEEGVNG